MANRTKIGYSSKWKILDFPTPKDYIKQVLDSVAVGVHPGYSYPEPANEIDGISFVVGIYQNSKNEKEKKLMAKAIVGLLDDEDYACDAIPVAAELGLEEAKEWFLNLIKKPVEELRKIKTTKYSSGLGAVTIYSDKQYQIFNYLKENLLQNKYNESELLSVIYRVGINSPDEIINNIRTYEKYIFLIGSESDTLQKIKFAISGILKKYGDSYSIELAKKYKSSLSKENQLLYVKALEEYTNGRFTDHLPEIKKILEIED